MEPRRLGLSVPRTNCWATAQPLDYDAGAVPGLSQDISQSYPQNYTGTLTISSKAVDIDNNSTNDVTFEYDALGRRVARTQGSDAVVFIQVDQQTIAGITLAVV
ncbi:MAG: hypothetical protein U0905_18470 [Pirellulales bacterium]